LRFQCATIEKFIPYSELDEANYFNVTLDWVLKNLEYHDSGCNLVWNTSKAPQKTGDFRKMFGGKEKETRKRK
jgi:hypothetical protein